MFLETWYFSTDVSQDRVIINKIKGADKKMYNKEQKVFSIDLNLVFKYLGFTKEKTYQIIEDIISVNPRSEYSKLARKINPFNLVRIEYVDVEPIMYTLSSNKDIANSRFAEILEPIMSIDSPEFYDKDILESILDFNTKEDSHITWVPVDQYNEELSYTFTFKPNANDMLSGVVERERHIDESFLHQDKEDN